MDVQTGILCYISIGGVSALRRTWTLREEISGMLGMHPALPLALLAGMVLHVLLWLPALAARGAEALFHGKGDSSEE